MALLASRNGSHPPPGMPDYDDICEDYPDYNTYDEMTDNMSTCSGSVNDILDHLNDEDLRDSADLDAIDFDDMTIPDVINVNGNHKYMSGSHYNLSNSVGLNSSANNKTLRDEAKNDVGNTGHIMSDKKKSSKPEQFVELAHKNNSSVNGSRDNCILSEFMQMRDAKFSKVTNDHQHHQKHDQQSDANANMMNDNEAQGRRGSLQGQRWSSTVSNPRLSKSSSNYSIKTVNSNPGSTVNSINRNRACPSPSFDARNLKNAKWSSTEDINHQRDNGGTSFRDLPQTWTPRNQPSPSPDRKDYRPIAFEGNSLKRNTQRSASSDGSLGPDRSLPAGDSFAWKDNGLDKDLRAIKDKKFSDAPEPKNGRDKKNDGLEKDLQRWANTPLPKPEDPDVILLKKARQEKKVKRYLEDNFQNRQGHFTPEPDPDSDIGSLQSKYSLDKRAEEEQVKESSPPKSPPPFSKAESRFEREQRIKIGSLDSYTPGNTLPRQKSISPPPAQSGAQQKYERERFRVEPGRIENYTIGKGTLAQQESYKAGLTKSTGGGIEGCGITKYSGSHSFNPLLMSKSSQNLSIKKSPSSDRNNLQRTLKDGYESDSTLSYRRHQFTPYQSANKSLYTQVQKGGEVPHKGLGMQAPEKKDYSRPSSAASGGWRGQEAPETEEELKKRQKKQLDMFYKSIDQTKETKLRVDLESRKHHDTLLPSQKSPLPHNRYEEDSNGNSTIFLNAGKKPTDCKMVAKALFSFQAQNSRELSFRKGDVIYIKKQVDNNWYEGERNAIVGIFPVTYVEILPNTPEVSTLSQKEKSNDGQAKARFNFTAQTPMELSLIKGEIITLTRRIDKNWYEGRIGSRKGILPVAYVDILSDPGSGDGGTNSGLSTLLPKPAAAPAAHSILKNGAVAASSYVPVYEKQKPVLGPGSASPYSTLSRDLSRPGSSMSNGKPEPTPFRALYNYKPMNDDEVELCEGDVVYVMEKCDDGWFVGTSQRTGIFGTFPGNYVTQV